MKIPSDIANYSNELCKPGILFCKSHYKKETLSSTDHPILSHLWIELTNTCNLSCIHCYADSGVNVNNSKNLSAYDFMKILKDGVKYGCRKVQFTGGEPTMHPKLRKIANYAHSIGYSVIEIFTNGNYKDKLPKKLLRQKKARLAISLYGHNEFVHESITGIRGSFNKTVSTIKWAVAEKIQFRVSVIIMSHNRDSIHLIAKFLNDLGVKDIQFDSVRNVGRGSQFFSNFGFHSECKANPNHGLCITSSGNMLQCVLNRDHIIGNFSVGLDTFIVNNSFQDTIVA